jgi:putative Ca2+/H+ antiporter (TMEM165/GDT1 family)
MNIKLFLTVFVTIFLAEIADKTQVATVLYASQAENNKLSVFLGSALALIIASGIAVYIGSLLSKWVNSRYLSWLAGIAFVLVGIWIILKA